MYLSPNVPRRLNTDSKWKVARDLIKSQTVDEDNSMKSMFKDLGKKGRLLDVISVLGNLLNLHSYSYET